MLSTLPNTLRAWRALRTDLAVVAGLVGLDIAARLLPHAPDFTPVAASALFAASVLRVRALSVVVPLAGMILADAWLGFYDLRIMAVVYGTLALPACAAWLSGRWRRPVMIAPLPFLQNMLCGDLFWGIVLFGGYWLARNVRTAKRDDRRTIAVRA